MGCDVSEGGQNINKKRFKQRAYMTLKGIFPSSLLLKEPHTKWPFWKVNVHPHPTMKASLDINHFYWPCVRRSFQNSEVSLSTSQK